MFARLSAGLQKLRQRAYTLTGNLDRRLSGVPGVLWDAIRPMLGARTGLSAAAIAYFALLSIFPVTLLSIAIASYSLGPSGNIAAVIQQLEFLAPTLGDLMGENVAGIIRVRGPVSIAAGVALLWSASSFFRSLGGILHDIWQAQYIRPIWQRYGIAMTLILLLAGPALVAGLAAGSFVASLSSYLPERFHYMALGLTTGLAVLLDIASFWVLYMAMPHGRGSPRDLLLGATGAGLLWEGAKHGFVAFVGTYMSRTNLVYGSVASIIAFLTWAYLSGMILLFGAYLSVSIHRYRIRRERAR
ncbi:MAG: YihY/virulence factor BrkB family protein [Anaerolineae bacterium]|jgi:membrane protein|nr:YihY/virulence factor BrkB family protein [Chloroflexota bacterium]